ncbi:MAG: PH domain-containing protein [Phycisphaerales bacterium]
MRRRGDECLKSSRRHPRIDLSNLITAEFEPTAAAKAIRTFGNGGMFSFTGLFYNKRLGTFRAFATDTKKAVIMRFPNRTIVVTPDDPVKFVLYVAEAKEGKKLK